MSDIIKLLPDSLANQIAAGEVVQRPASVVKELLENAVDAGSSKIKLIIKDGGKKSITIMDDGCGMSPLDARMCFERHATSKLKNSSDLFAITTFGFRGEAMASIAAVAQVELKTRPVEDEVGTKIVVEATSLNNQEPCQTPIGTSITVKNLFFNIPARRAFLKSNTVELKHIDEEFKRVALANPSIQFSFYIEDEEMAFLPACPLKQRVINIFGTNTQNKWVGIHEDTESVKIFGLVSKPEAYKKTRGDQYLFVNGRFIRSPYLQHAIFSAFEGMIPEGGFPMYVVFLEIDPSKIDVNVHPTKQEIKFEEEKVIYNYLKVTVRHALGLFALTPSLDFELDPGTRSLFDSKVNRTNSADYNFPSASDNQERNQGASLDNWQDLYKDINSKDLSREETLVLSSQWDTTINNQNTADIFNDIPKKPFQLQNTYIITQIKSGLIVIDQQTAHQRILFEKYLSYLDNSTIAIQKELFPKNIKLSFNDARLLKDNLNQIKLMGFEIEEFGHDTFIVQGVPSGLSSTANVEEIIESFLFQLKNENNVKISHQENLAWSMAKSSTLPKGQDLTSSEMNILIEQLFSCENPYLCPNGKKCFFTLDMDDISKKLM